ncbi:glutamine amidotransferase class-I [Ferroglobus placidus DSM 10642]|uniref:Glutamine amidotransferase class-I n=1 Tax=Ferroglobus placidus (strain DSM 10642 / AEDII12DO) TaxID=589924 RepID=D3RZA1_FERPA|nr:GMP synthase [Ferroglobus placidus]ADC65814.1 glutamine amidotransferase class-I [Ferroglobus placidus DSM 10642]
MKVVAIQHSPVEPLGYIEKILEEKGIAFDYERVYETNEVRARYASHIIILGGPMGAYEDDLYPFLSEEKNLIREAIKNNLPILGICLGAQLIASAMGSKVYPYKKELGWYDVKKVGDDEITRGLPEKMRVFQWHNDTFDLPNDSKLLYEGKVVRNQAFRLGKAIGLQFHIEMTLDLIKTWLKYEKGMDEEEKSKIIEDSKIFLPEMQRSCKILLENFLKL